MILSGMFPFYFLFLLIATASYFFDLIFNVKAARGILFFTFLFILAIFAGTRTGWPDQDIYEWVFSQVPPLPEFLFGGTQVDFREEYMFIVLNSVIKCFSADPVVMFLVMAFISLGITLFVYKKYSPFFMLSVLFYTSVLYPSREMEQIRMAIASALILLGLAFLVEKKRNCFVMMVFFASLFQASAFFSLFGYLLYRLNLTTKKILFLLICSFFIGTYFPLAYKFFNIFLKANIGGSLLERGASYYGNQEYGHALGVVKPYSLKLLCGCLLSMIFRKTLNARVKYFEVMFIFLSGALMWYFLFNDLAIIAVRGANIMSVGEPLIFASFLLLFNTAGRYFIVFIFYMVCFLIFYLSQAAFNYPEYISVLFN